MVESYVNILETRLKEFLQVLPRLEIKRGLVDLGGSVLKTLFGTATIADLHQVHLWLTMAMTNWLQMMMVMKTEMYNDLLILKSKTMKSCTHQIKSGLIETNEMSRACGAYGGG
jgi:hypothetical protein